MNTEQQQSTMTRAATQNLNIVFVGHVDHGKSTVVGRLLADTGSLPEGKLEQVKDNCERNSKPFEYAFLIDALKDEQSQGITIDMARVFFKTEKREYIIIDAPGHIEFLKNMITGASHAGAALLVIDANEGIRENSRRHGYMLSLLGIRQIAVLVNKMDLVNYNGAVFDRIVTEYGAFLKEIDVTPLAYIPISGTRGDNITPRINTMDWYKGKSVLEVLDDFAGSSDLTELPFRMPVQDVYKFTAFGDSRRIIAGTIQTGAVAVGDEVIFYPSGKKSRISSIEAFNRAQPTAAAAPWSTGFTLAEQLYVKRGEMAVKVGEVMPQTTTQFQASLFWLGKNPMTTEGEYLIKIGTAKIPVRLTAVHRLIDASSLDAIENTHQIGRHDVADCTLTLARAAAFDLSGENQYTSRFVIIDDYEITGGGIINRALDDRSAWVREKVLIRNYKWERSIIPAERRQERYNQCPTLILVTGRKGTGKKTLARALEQRLFDDGRVVYFLGIGNILYGVDADIKGAAETDRREEHIRRLAEVVNLMMDAGVIVIVTAIELNRDDLAIIETTVPPERTAFVWLGDGMPADLEADLVLGERPDTAAAVEETKDLLQQKGVISRPL